MHPEISRLATPRTDKVYNPKTWEGKKARVFSSLKNPGRFLKLSTSFLDESNGWQHTCRFIFLGFEKVLSVMEAKSDTRYDAVIDASFSEPNRQKKPMNANDSYKFLSFPQILMCFPSLRLSLVSTWGILSRNTTSTTIEVLQPFGLRSVDPTCLLLPKKKRAGEWTAVDCGCERVSKTPVMW